MAILPVTRPIDAVKLDARLRQAVGGIFYSASTVCFVPASLSQEVGAGLGAQAGPKRIGEVVGQGGFQQFRTATKTPFNLVFEARP